MQCTHFVRLRVCICQIPRLCVCQRVYLSTAPLIQVTVLVLCWVSLVAQGNAAGHALCFSDAVVIILLVDGALIREPLPICVAWWAVNSTVPVGNLSILLQGICIVQEFLGRALLPLYVIKATDPMWDVVLRTVVQPGILRAINVHGRQTWKFRYLISPFRGAKCNFVHRGGFSCNRRCHVRAAGGSDVSRSVHSETQVQVGAWENPQDGNPIKENSFFFSLLTCTIVHAHTPNTPLWQTRKDFWLNFLLTANSQTSRWAAPPSGPLSAAVLPGQEVLVLVEEGVLAKALRALVGSS